MDSTSNMYLYSVFILYLLPMSLIGQATKCSNQTVTIGCGSPSFISADHTKSSCADRLNTRVNLPFCGNGNIDTTVYWYFYQDLCKENRTQTTFFASVKLNNPSPRNNETCSQGRNLTISNETCMNSFEFTNNSMIIKNLTNGTVGRYICFYGMGLGSISNSSAISYEISLDGQYGSPHSNRSDENRAILSFLSIPNRSFSRSISGSCFFR